ELILHEAPRPVQPVPVTHAVQGVKERGEGLCLAHFVSRGRAKPEFVKELHAPAVQETTGRDERNRQRSGAWSLERRVLNVRARGVVAPGQYGSALAGAT